MDTTTRNLLIGGVALLALGGAAYLLMGKKKTTKMTANRRRRRGRRVPAYMRFEENPRGTCSVWKKRVKRCHCSPPKKYRRKGATLPGDYAFPECFMYPIRFRKGKKVQRQLTVAHVRNAASRFGKSYRSYPKQVRRKIARNIRKAARRYGVGYVSLPR